MIGGRFGVAVLLAGLLGLAGCSEDKRENTPVPVVTATTSVAETPEVTATVPMAPKAERSAAGAVAFVRYFWEVYNYSYASGDPAILAAVSSAECKFCIGATSEISRAQTQGLKQTGGHIEPVTVIAAPGNVESSLVVISVLNQDASEVIGENGAVVATSKALTSINADARIEWSSNSWQMRALTIETERS